MKQNESDAGSLHASRKMLAQLEGLKRTSIGVVIYDQLARLVEEQELRRMDIDQIYGSMLRLLLDTYAREPTAEQVTRINAQLIQMRRPALAPSAPGGALSETIEQQIRKAAAGQGEFAEPPVAPVSTTAAAVPTTPPAASIPNETEASEIFPESAAVDSAQIERRVNTAYRLHLDRKRSEIDKLQGALAKSVTEAVTQNREFGALLKIELRALQQAEGTREIEDLRKILIGGIEELINGQTSLEAKLQRTGSFLKLIKADSERLHDELHKVRLLSLTDEFTGLPNRRAFMRRLQDETSRSQRYGSSLALAMVDLDGFKAINDEHGHAAGDQILRCYATEVLSVLRHHDMVARYGGEEFAVILSNTTGEGAVAAINKVRGRLSEVQCDYEGRILPLPTFSTGITLYTHGESHMSLIDRADRALYRAKRLGRNRIELELTASTDATGPEQTSGNGD